MLLTLAIDNRCEHLCLGVQCSTTLCRNRSKSRYLQKRLDINAFTIGCSRGAQALPLMFVESRERAARDFPPKGVQWWQPTLENMTMGFHALQSKRTAATTTWIYNIWLDLISDEHMK